jgi:hypothetical protein
VKDQAIPAVGKLGRPRKSVDATTVTKLRSLRASGTLLYSARCWRCHTASSSKRRSETREKICGTQWTVARVLFYFLLPSDSFSLSALYCSTS